MNRVQRLAAVLTENLSPTHLRIDDETPRHAGHLAGGGDETHLKLTIESPRFAGMSKVKRHQAIYALLGEEFNTGLHALAIEATAPGEKKQD